MIARERRRPFAEDARQPSGVDIVLHIILGQVQSVLECVGTEQAMDTSMGIVRAGGAVGRVGVPHYEALKHAQQMFYRNVIVAGGPAPTRAYIDELLPEVLDGRIDPGRVFDRTVDLDGVPDGYRAMNEREVLKVLIRP